LKVNPALKLVIFKLNPGVTDKIFISTLEATTKTWNANLGLFAAGPEKTRIKSKSRHEALKALNILHEFSSMAASASIVCFAAFVLGSCLARNRYVVRAQQLEARLDLACSVRVLREACGGCVIGLQSGLECEPSVFGQTPDNQPQQHQKRDRQEQCGEYLEGRTQRGVCLLSLAPGTPQISCLAARVVLAWVAEEFVYCSLLLHHVAFRAEVKILEVVC
jgi:hypothetical protein